MPVQLCTLDMESRCLLAAPPNSWAASWAWLRSCCFTAFALGFAAAVGAAAAVTVTVASAAWLQPSSLLRLAGCCMTSTNAVVMSAW